MQPEEEEREQYDESERRQLQDFKIGTRRTPLSNNVLMLLGDILQPQTTGFNQINMDMSFTYQDSFGVFYVKNSSFLINFFNLYGFKRALYLERGNLATHLVASRSLNGESMKLFTNTVTQQKQEFVDRTEKKTGFTKLFSRKEQEQTTGG